MSKWTLFWDMHSGGGTKEKDYDKIYIEAPETEAEVIFYNRFGHSPRRVSCTRCGDHYSISEEESLEQLSAFHRGCDGSYVNEKGEKVSEEEAWVFRGGVKPGYSYKYFETSNSIPLEKYLKQNEVLVIYDIDINDNERVGEVPEQGYVWK